jgi:hypothetical protein
VQDEQGCAARVAQADGEHPRDRAYPDALGADGSGQRLRRFTGADPQPSVMLLAYSTADIVALLPLTLAASASWSGRPSAVTVGRPGVTAPPL